VACKLALEGMGFGILLLLCLAVATSSPTDRGARDAAYQQQLDALGDVYRRNDDMVRLF